MKPFAVALAAVIAFALLLAMALPALAGAASARPVCPRVTLSTAIVGGQYAGVECSDGSALTVTLKPGQDLPAAGPAAVRQTQRRGVVTYDLVAGGVRYPIVTR